MPVTQLLSPTALQWLDKSAESEMYAHFLYQYIANQLQRLGLFGSQQYFLKESVDELAHYNILVGFVNDMGGCLGTPAVPKIGDSVKNISDALEIAYETELSLLNHYKEFYNTIEEEDAATAVFLNQFLSIQTKSVGEYGDLIARLSLNPTDVFEFDEYLSEK